MYALSFCTALQCPDHAAAAASCHAALLGRSVEEQQLQDKMQADHHEARFDMDEASHRLNEIYERMQEVRHTS